MPNGKLRMNRKYAAMQNYGEYKNFIRKFLVHGKEADSAIKPAFQPHSDEDPRIQI